MMKAVEITKAERIYKNLLLSYDEYEEFEWAMVERKFPARPIETEKLEGWAMFELDKVDAAKGGAPRAHVDALRLLAVFLAHWDNKSKNQRLVCLSQEDWKDGERCEQPFLLLQDVGATFGPSKVDLEEWKAATIWEDRATCRASMADLPYDGATFAPVHISEAGRRQLAGMLARLSDPQVTDLFAAATLRSARRPVQSPQRDRGLGRRLQGEGPRDHRGAAVPCDDVGIRYQVPGCPALFAAHVQAAETQRHREDFFRWTTL